VVAASDFSDDAVSIAKCEDEVGYASPPKEAAIQQGLGKQPAPISNFYEDA